MSPSFHDVLIVGAGHAGAQLALSLRQQGFEGSIGLVGDEPLLPYERPPLSKEYFSGEKTFERLLIRSESVWAERMIEMMLGRKVVSVDPEAHVALAADGGKLGYGQLVWATGGAPRKLSCDGHSVSGVHSVRTRADVDAMLGELDSVSRVVVIGGGYIGLEAAAVLRKMGKQVTVLEALDRVLARVAGEPLSRFFEDEHRDHGVDIRLGVQVSAIRERQGRADGVCLADGEVVPADMVIVGIGIIPAVTPLLSAGAMGGNGVDVDGFCRTSLQDVFAIGDCAMHSNAFAGGAAIRLESVQNANDQAAVVARVIMGGEAAYHAIPWFWSNQYDLRLQTVGLSIGHDEIVVRGDIGTRSFSLVYLKAGRVIALDCVNATRDYAQGRALVSAGARISPVLLADLSQSLKDLALA